MFSRLFKFGMVAGGSLPKKAQLFVGFRTSPYSTEEYSVNASADSFTAGGGSLLPSTMQTSKVKYSPDGKFVAILANGGDRLYVYRRDASGYVKVALGNTPNPILDTTGRGVSFSADGQFLAVVTYDTTHIYLYKLSADGSTYNQVSLSGTTANSYIFSGCISPDGTYMAVGYTVDYHGAAIWKRNPDNTFTYLSRTDPSATDVNNPYGLAWSKDSNKLFIANYNEPALAVYQRSGDTFTRFTQVNSLGGAMDVAISPDETHVAITGYTTPFLAIFKWNGSTLTKIANTPTLPAKAWSLSYSADGNYLAVGHESAVAGAVKFSVFKRNGDVYTKIPDFTSGNGGTDYDIVAFGAPYL